MVRRKCTCCRRRRETTSGRAPLWPTHPARLLSLWSRKMRLFPQIKAILSLDLLNSLSFSALANVKASRAGCRAARLHYPERRALFLTLGARGGDARAMIFLFLTFPQLQPAAKSIAVYPYKALFNL